LGGKSAWILRLFLWVSLGRGGVCGQCVGDFRVFRGEVGLRRFLLGIVGDLWDFWGISGIDRVAWGFGVVCWGNHYPDFCTKKGAGVHELCGSSGQDAPIRFGRRRGNRVTGGLRMGDGTTHTCRTDPLRAGRSLRDSYTASPGAPVGRDRRERSPRRALVRQDIFLNGSLLLLFP